MDYIGRALVTDNGTFELRDRTIDFSGAWARFPDWHPHGAYGYELDLLNGELGRNPWLHAWLLNNGFREVGYRTKLYDNNKWIMLESRNESMPLSDLMVYVDTFVMKYHIEDVGVLIGKRNSILWVEELDHNGYWESIGEMFAF